MFGIFKKAAPKPTQQARSSPIEQEPIEEYQVATFVPRKIPMTSELLRRQREEEIVKKYCNSNAIKTAVMR